MLSHSQSAESHNGFHFKMDESKLNMKALFLLQSAAAPRSKSIAQRNMCPMLFPQKHSAEIWVQEIVELQNNVKC